MDQGEVEIVVQTGNLTEPPKHGSSAHRNTWKVTQEWKIRVPLSLTAEGLTDHISKVVNKKLWPHELSILLEKPVVLRQGEEKLTALGIKDGSVLRFWNGMWQV